MDSNRIAALSRSLWVRCACSWCGVITLGLDTYTARLPSDSEQIRQALPAWVLPLAPVHPGLCVYPRASFSQYFCPALKICTVFPPFPLSKRKFWLKFRTVGNYSLQNGQTMICFASTSPRDAPACLVLGQRRVLRGASARPSPSGQGKIKERWNTP